MRYWPPSGIVCSKTKAPISLADLAADEDVELRIFIDKYLVELFVNGRQGLLAAYPEYRAHSGVDAFTVGEPTLLKKVEIWKLRPANDGFCEAQKSRIWEPKTK
ncbi:MAG: hypothetical protein FJ295_21080 [Planctomycetes bacterium]|nr:hypothetical protein [Planctomycetota bacterium]